MRVGNGANIYAPAPQAYNPPAPAPSYSAQPGYSPELENIKATMTRDVSALLGADSAPVMQKIQGCRTKDELFATMMGIKKIITIYTNREAAEKFGARYLMLSN